MSGTIYRGCLRTGVTETTLAQYCPIVSLFREIPRHHTPTSLNLLVNTNC